MLKINFSIFLITIFFSQATFLKAEEKFLSLKKSKVNVRYGPSFEFPVKFIYKKKNLPIKQIDKKENFRRIIDHKKNSGWIHISQLKKINSVISTKDKILFKNSTKFSEPLAKIREGRLLIIQKCEKEWCRVETEKIVGWVDKSGLWGL
ncbi:SH3 domain-containing protein [Candidatus Pelagibacter communis]|uniref:SH3 domain-containing protein n=1 Tax=Pelagibacter ubique TaxID=198252 RepID=UPI00094D9874|nr:SH3 domain-containing protein [Candidatus Pelagibacter ubique]|tara:strand:- start:759 stop:1205 length:447 start_codon:yes stop_codon:yes gene_type:complete